MARNIRGLSTEGYIYIYMLLVYQNILYICVYLGPSSGYNCCQQLWRLVVAQPSNHPAQTNTHIVEKMHCDGLR